MKIIGPDSLVFGVDDLETCSKFLLDYGLTKTESSASGGSFAALDGTSIIIRKSNDSTLPTSVAPAPTCRETIYGVVDKASLEAIGAELSKDRDVKLTNGVLHSTDADGYGIGFQITQRRDPQARHYGVNVPYQAPGRPHNEVAANDDAHVRPYSLSHIMFFSPDSARAEKFYVSRLGFRVTDYFAGAGAFMRPAANNDHHTVFFLQAPRLGVQHFTFHFAGASEVLKNGWEMVRKGHQSFWGPGRHLLGSNYFWYFNSPLGGIMEMDADMDRHDDAWTPRSVPVTKDTSQIFLLQHTEKWLPHG
jgi:catechol 2,3-dioxygenase-like lactoylglutathione lyase family enzyme